MPSVRALIRRSTRTVAYLAVLLFLLLSVAGVALACVEPAEPTTLTTSLSGESKSGASITVLEGSKVKDQATLEGKNAAKATGKISYAVYKDSSCKELVAKAGESEFKEGKVPASEEKTLEGGKTYYWQAHYGGDSLNAESTSACGAEVLSVKAATSVSTSLSGESKSGAEITVLEGIGVKDKATLSGTNSATATGKVKFKIYKDSECKELAAETEGSLSGGSAESAEQKLAGGIVYYWVASYEGDSLHQSSTGSCGSERLFVKAPTSLSTSLSGEEESGATITVLEGAKVKDKATLSGVNSTKATGMVTYRVYGDPECKEFVTGAGEVTVTSGSVPASTEMTLEGGKVYYWEAEYSGDTTHSVSKSTCGSEKVTVKAATSLSTLLHSWSPENEEEELEGSELDLTEGFPAGDSATLSGTNVSTATGEIAFKLYSDNECETLVEGAGSAALEGELTVYSEEVGLAEGTYYWQAEYEGDALHQSSKSPCGSETMKVRSVTTISTKLEGGVVIESGESGESGEVVEVEEGEAVNDTATLEGANVSTATGTVEYNIYADSACSEFVETAGEKTVSEGEVPSSEAVTLEPAVEPGIYFFQARYSGNVNNSPSASECGTEILVVQRPPVGPPAPKHILHKQEAGVAGAALAVPSQVEGTSATLEFVTEAGRKIECTTSTLEGTVTKNDANLAVVNLTKWEFKNGGLEPGRCRTTIFVAGEALEAIVTVMKRGNLQFTAPAAGPVGTGTIGPFKVRVETYTKKAKFPLDTCEFGRRAVPVMFTFGAVLGLQLKALNLGLGREQRLVLKGPEPPPPLRVTARRCGNNLALKGPVTVTTKVGAIPVIPTK
jgi:hypothetical protein